MERSITRVAVLLLGCLSAAVPPIQALAGPPGEAPATATTASAQPAKAEPAAHQTAAKGSPDADTRHFLALGYKPEKRGAEEIYCRREIALGSRLSPVKNCGTIEQLKLAEQRTKAGLYDAQRQQATGPRSN